MRILLMKSELERVLTAATSPIPTRASLPIMTHVLIQAERAEVGTDAVVHFVGSDLSFTVEMQAMNCAVEQSGELCIPGMPLLQLVKALPEAMVRIAQSGERVKVTCGKHSSFLPFMPASEFPQAKTALVPIFKMPARMLMDIAVAVAPMATDEISRPDLLGVHLQYHNGALRAAASDTMVFAVLTFEVPDVPADFQVSIPPVAFESASKLFAGDEVVEVRKYENHMEFAGENASLRTRLFEAKPPAFDMVLGHIKPNRIFRSSCAELLAVFRRLNVIAPDLNSACVMDMSTDLQELRTTDRDTGSSQESVDGGSFEGEPIMIGFNLVHVQKVLRAAARVCTGQIRVKFMSPLRPVLIEPDVDNPTSLFLSSPVRPEGIQDAKLEAALRAQAVEEGKAEKDRRAETATAGV